MHENFISSINKRNESADEIAKATSLINQMKLINENVKELLVNFEEENLNDHDSFLLFRGKVSKRIIDYTTLVTRCYQIVSCNDIPQNLKEEFNYHSKNVEKHKKELSLWWQKFEKEYHRMCVKMFLEKKENETNALKDDGPEEITSNMNLADTKKMMMEEVNRMKNVKSELKESSDKLKKQDASFNSFENKIKYSTQLVFSLKKKAETDTKYVWFSFFFFLFVCAYIILRRLGFIRAIFSMTKLLLSFLLYIAKQIFKWLVLFKKKVFSTKELEQVQPFSSIIVDSSIPVNEL